MRGTARKLAALKLDFVAAPQGATVCEGSSTEECPICGSWGIRRGEVFVHSCLIVSIPYATGTRSVLEPVVFCRLPRIEV